MIVITTPTGNIGREVLANLLAADTPVRVIARDPERLAPEVRDRAEIVQGSHGDGETLAEAVSGATSVFWLMPPNPRITDFGDYYLDFTRSLCDAITNHGVKRVVAVSTVGRGIDVDAGPVSAAMAMDRLIESTGVNYRSVSPPGFMENLLQQVEPIRDQGMFFSPLSADVKQAYCATGDIAAVASRLLLDDSWSGQQSVPVLGPEDLSNSDMVRIMSEVLGRSVRFQHVSMDQYKETVRGFGATPEFAQGLADMHAAHAQIKAHTPARTAESASPTSFRQWCEEVLKPAILS